MKAACPTLNALSWLGPRYIDYLRASLGVSWKAEPSQLDHSFTLCFLKANILSRAINVLGTAGGSMRRRIRYFLIRDHEGPRCMECFGTGSLPVADRDMVM
jgi:hypothetical protein